MTPALVLDGVSFTIGGANLTNDVSLSLNPGDRMALMGPNGAGKTTLMNLVAGVYRPTAGRISLDGSDITRWSSPRRARAGLARTFQITNLCQSLTVEENLAIAVGSTSLSRFQPFRRWRHVHTVWEKVDDLIERSGLSAIRGTIVSNLPYGDQRKLEIVVAVARPAKVVMLDEPGAGLTASEAENLIELVFGLSDDLAVLFIDHDVDLVQRLATRMTLLDLGEVVASGTPDEVAASEAFGRIYLEGDMRA